MQRRLWALQAMTRIWFSSGMDWWLRSSFEHLESELGFPPVQALGRSSVVREQSAQSEAAQTILLPLHP